MKRNKGITLIALVVTIIVLLILAGISIAMLTGQNGIITRTNEARDENVKGTEREQISLAYTAEQSILLEKESTERVKAEDLENRLRTDGAKVTSVEDEDESLKVTFDTGNVYYVDYDGNISNDTSGQPINPPVLGEVEEPTGTLSRDFDKPCGVVEIAWLDLENNVIKEPLSPNLGDMEKVAWDNSSNEVTPSSNSDWYNYNTNKWANAKNPEDGSYFVWIPRYGYKIIYFNNETNKNKYIADNTSQTGIIGYSTIYGIVNTKGEVIQGTQTNITDTVQTAGYRDYIPHPGFLGTGYEDIGGGFGDNAKGISGIWVAKYESASERSLDSGVTWTASSGGGATTKAGGKNFYIRVVSKPGVISWREILVSNCYENSYHYHRDRESHLMKNSEWGAVAYLSHSKYGRNGAEITVNDNDGEGTFYTGGGAGTAYKINTNQSSTGNIYGIYDLNGNAREYVAAYNKEYNDYFYNHSAYFSETGKMFASYNGVSTKYATAYSNSTESSSGNYAVGNVSFTGDALREVWYRFSQGWFSNSIYYPDTMYPFIQRGMYGLFDSINMEEEPNSSYRVVLAK